MLKIYDRYILKKFLTTFFFILGVIMLLAIVFDISEKLKDFIEKKAPLSDVILNYYVNFIVFYGNTFSSLIVFITVIWFTSKMAQDSEIIPMLFSGKPFSRILRPYMIGAAILTLLSFILNHYIVPRSNESRLQFEERYYRDNLYINNFIAEFPDNTIVYFDHYNTGDKIIANLKIEKWSEKNQLEKLIQAGSAQYKEEAKKWQLNNYFIREINSPASKTKEIVPDKIMKGIQYDTILPFETKDIASRNNNSEAMTFTELQEYIKAEKKKGNPNYVLHEIELHRRTSYPFATFILTLIGFSVSSQKKRGGIGLNIAIGLGFAFIYIFSMKVTTVAAINVGLPTFIAVWIPNLIFLLIGIMLYKLAPK
ncbi:MAG: LptF/LptG family permease [Flavobacteriia bacterium]|nr:LptF/LptG family permease [Flavobacteriia bacterium]OJX37429.1 MAG: hypothetical protein BGO87_00265 [Flavobacteriia bacterium 40-80]